MNKLGKRVLTAVILAILASLFFIPMIIHEENTYGEYYGATPTVHIYDYQKNLTIFSDRRDFEDINYVGRIEIRSWNFVAHFVFMSGFFVLFYLILLNVDTIYRFHRKIQEFVFNENSLILNRRFIGYYLIWIMLNGVLYVFGGLHHEYDEYFYPFEKFELEYYGIVELFIYIIAPIAILYSVRLITSNKKIPEIPLDKSEVNIEEK